MAVQLFTHQQEVLDISKTRNTLNIADCGLGKCVSSLATMDYHFKKGRGAALIICPKNLIYDAWMSDIKEYFPHLDAVAVYGTDPAKRVKALYEDHQIYISTPQTMKIMFPLIQDRGFDQIYIDESSCLKSIKSQTTKSILTLAGFRFRGREGVKFLPGRAIPHRYALTATPAPNSPEEYYSQVKFLTGPGNDIFHENFFTFQSKFFMAIDVTPKAVKQSAYYNERRDQRIKHVFRREMFEEFCYKLAEVAYVCRKSDTSDITLPDQKHIIHNIDLSQSERTAYDTMARDLLLQINRKEIKAANVLSEVMKLRQLTSGFIYGQDGNDTETHRTGATKFEYLKHLISQEPEEQRIHFINFREEARQMSKLPNSAVIDGTSKKNPEIFAAFRRGEIQHLVANQQSMSHGVTFVNCARTTYYSMNHSYELMKQSRERTHRIGQTRDCNYDYVHAKNSMDGLIFTACVRKEATVNAFLAVLVEIQNGGTPVFTDAQEVFQASFTDIMKQLVYQHLREEV